VVPHSLDGDRKNSGGDFGVARGPNHSVEGRQKNGIIKLTGNSERDREITRPHKENIDPWNLGDLSHVLQGGRGFDLHDSEQRVIHTLDIATIASELSGPVVRGETPITARWVPEVAYGTANLVGRIEPRKHNARHSQVQDVAHANALRCLHPDKHWYSVRRAREKLARQPLFAARAVLEIDKQPVKSTQRADLRGAGGTKVEERTARGVAVVHQFAEHRHDVTVCAPLATTASE
jgi:hypothetical protein